MLEVMKSCNGQRSLQSAMSITFQWDLGEGSDKRSDKGSMKPRMVKETRSSFNTDRVKLDIKSTAMLGEHSSSHIEHFTWQGTDNHQHYLVRCAWISSLNWCSRFGFLQKTTIPTEVMGG